MACCEFHDRLDLKLTVQQYVSAACGSIKADKDAGSMAHKRDPETGEYIVEGKPEYCCFECPVLLEKHATRQEG
jgi:hypothetical protein